MKKIGGKRKNLCNYQNIQIYRRGIGIYSRGTYEYKMCVLNIHQIIPSYTYFSHYNNSCVNYTKNKTTKKNI